jgi:hypothetical protein
MLLFRARVIVIMNKIILYTFFRSMWSVSVHNERFVNSLEFLWKHENKQRSTTMKNAHTLRGLHSCMRPAHIWTLFFRVEANRKRLSVEFKESFIIFLSQKFVESRVFAKPLIRNNWTAIWKFFMIISLEGGKEQSGRNLNQVWFKFDETKKKTENKHWTNKSF